MESTGLWLGVGGLAGGSGAFLIDRESGPLGSSHMSHSALALLAFGCLLAAIGYLALNWAMILWAAHRHLEGRHHGGPPAGAGAGGQPGAGGGGGAPTFVLPSPVSGVSYRAKWSGTGSEGSVVVEPAPQTGNNGEDAG